MMQDSEKMSMALTAAAGMAVGAMVMYASTQDSRSMRKMVRKLSRDAERCICSVDKAVENLMR